MAYSRGRAEVRRFIARLPLELEEKVLRGAARAGIDVVADDARARVTSDEVRDGITTRVRREGELIVGKATIEGSWARSVGNWLEYGTDPHYITVDDSQRQGMSANRINTVGKAGTLVIRGKPVGRTVFHPGARPHPFFRVALDMNERAAVAAAQAYINSRVTRSGIVGTAEKDDE